MCIAWYYQHCDMSSEPYMLSLIYDEHINRFLDENGDIVYGIYNLVTPNQVMLFKKQKRRNRLVVMDVSNSFLVELIYKPVYSDDFH